MLLEECSFASEPRGQLFMVITVPAVLVIQLIPYGNQTPENPKTEITALEGPAPSTLTRTPNPEKGISQYLPSLKVGSHHICTNCVSHFLHRRFLTYPNFFHRKMNSPQNTDQDIEMQCMEAEQMIIEHDISKEQRKKKKKNKKNENPSSPNDEDLHLHRPNDEDEDLQEEMKEKGEIMEVQQPTFAMEERAMESHSYPANSSPLQPIVNAGPPSVESIALPTTVPNLQHRKGLDLDLLKKNLEQCSCEK